MLKIRITHKGTEKIHIQQPELKSEPWKAALLSEKKKLPSAPPCPLRVIQLIYTTTLLDS